MNTLRSVLVVLAVVGASEALAKDVTPCAGVVSKTVAVDGRNDEWTATGIKVKAGDLVVLMADGKVKVGNWTGDVGPNGAADGNGKLTIKVGTGTVISVGQKWFGVFEEDAGPLKLRVQDTNYRDNSGSFKVVIIVIPGGAIPEPEVVEAG